MIITLKNANFSTNNIGTLNTYSISFVGSGVTNSNTSVDRESNTGYTTTITLGTDYELNGSITVTMGGTDITSTAVSGLTITIPTKVTGNVVITVPTKNTAGEPDAPTGLTLMRANSRVEQDSSNNLTYIEDITCDTYSLPVDENSTYNLNFGNVIALTSGSTTQAVSNTTYGTKNIQTFNSSVLTQGKAYAGDNISVGAVMPEPVNSSANAIYSMPVKKGMRVRVKGHTYLSAVLLTLTDENNIIYTGTKIKNITTTSFTTFEATVEKDGYLYSSARTNDTDDYLLTIETISPSVQIETGEANTLIISAEKTKTFTKEDLITGKCFTQGVGDFVGNTSVSGMGNSTIEPQVVRAGDTVTVTSTTQGSPNSVILADANNICYAVKNYKEASDGITITIEQDSILYINAHPDNDFSVVINFATSGFVVTKQ